MFLQKCSICGNNFNTTNVRKKICVNCLKKKAESWTKDDIVFVRIRFGNHEFYPLHKVVGYDKAEQEVIAKIRNLPPKRERVQLSDIVAWVKCCDECSEDSFPNGEYELSPASALRENFIERCPKCGRYVK